MPFDDSNETAEFGSARILKSRASEWGPDGTWVTRRDMNTYLHVWPEKKFAFCSIEQNAPIQFNRLMNHLNGIDGLVDESAWHQRGVSLSEVTKANGWRFGVFLRDPAERVLTAWSNKCVKKSWDWEEGGMNCLGGQSQIVDGQKTDLIDAFEHAVTLLPAYMKNSGTTKGNIHWDPQVLFCDVLPLADYDFIGHLSGGPEAVYSEVKQMFEHTANVPREHPTFWQALSDKFPQHVDKASDALTKMQTFYRSPDTYELVKRAYDIDYKTLPLKPGHYE